MTLEGGEFIRNKDVVEKEKTPNQKIFDICSGIKIQNTYPDFSKKPEDTFYWKGDRLENVRKGLAEIDILVGESDISEVANPFNQEEKINLQEFIDKVKRSIEYSEQINLQAQNRPEVSEEEKLRRKAEMRRKLLGEQ